MAGCWGVTITQDAKCQHDICRNRPADAGSSCCTLFGARLSIKVLLAAPEQQLQHLAVAALQKLLASCVQEWDRSGQDGAVASEMIRRAASSASIAVDVKVDEVVMDRAGLSHVLSDARVDTGVLVTANH